ncbi:hypothetical protein E1162_00770 [Rhodobacteraceae bacterium RKSG542]|nr:hypothetical protein [Pseudovibrio flavus]
MIDLPKVQKTTTKGLFKKERIKSGLLGLLVGLAFTTALSLEVPMAQAASNATSFQVEHGAMLLSPPEISGDTIAYHYSHRSHYSHSSHRSHYSHYSSRW